MQQFAPLGVLLPDMDQVPNCCTAISLQPLMPAKDEEEFTGDGLLKGL